MSGALGALIAILGLVIYFNYLKIIKMSISSSDHVSKQLIMVALVAILLQGDEPRVIGNDPKDTILDLKKNYLHWLRADQLN